MTDNEKPQADVPQETNVLEAYVKAVEVLLNLAQNDKDENVRLDAARAIVDSQQYELVLPDEIPYTE